MIDDQGSAISSHAEEGGKAKGKLPHVAEQEIEAYGKERVNKDFSGQIDFCLR